MCVIGKRFTSALESFSQSKKLLSAFPNDEPNVHLNPAVRRVLSSPFLHTLACRRRCYLLPPEHNYNVRRRPTCKRPELIARLPRPSTSFPVHRVAQNGMNSLQLFVVDFDTCIVWELLLLSSNTPNLPSSLKGNRWEWGVISVI